MLHAASRLLAQPDWLLDRAQHYGALAEAEAALAARAAARRVLWALAALALAAVALNLAGMAVLMAAGREGQAAWLWAVPLLPALLALAAALAARRPLARAFPALREQIAADVQQLRQPPGTGAQAQATQALRQLAERHPLALLAAGAGTGALVALATPRRFVREGWRWLRVLLGQELANTLHGLLRQGLRSAAGAAAVSAVRQGLAPSADRAGAGRSLS